jgi:hypothetical protein
VARTPNSLVAKENPRTLKTNPENKIRGGRFGTECRMKELAKRLKLLLKLQIRKIKREGVHEIQKLIFPLR